MTPHVEAILAALREHPLLRRIATVARGRGRLPIYLVGGVLRDALLGRPFSPDIDLVAPDPLAFARALEQAFAGKAVALDERCQRVIFPWGEGRARVDIAPLRGSDIEEDLHLRDFTMNAIAAPLGEEPIRLFDPLGGLRDLGERRVRMCHPHVFTEDPLRLLRAIRLASLLDFTLHEETEEAIRRQAHLLPRAAAERIREEVFQILDQRPVDPWVATLDTLGLLEILLPEIREGRARALERVRSLDGILSHLEDLFPEEASTLETHLAGEVEGGISRRALLPFVALLVELGQGRTETAQSVCSRLRLGNRAAQQVKVLIREGERPVELWRRGGLAPLEADRFFRELGECAADLLLLSFADHRATEGYHRFLQELLAFYRERVAPWLGAPLLRGDDLLSRLNLPPGPFIGFLLERVHQEGVLGHLNSREEALRYLEGHLDALREEFAQRGKSP